MTADEVWDRVHQYALDRLADQQPVFTNAKGIRNFIADVKDGSIGRKSDDGTTNASRVTRSQVAKAWDELNGGPRDQSVLYFTYALIAAAMPDVVENTSTGLKIRDAAPSPAPAATDEASPEELIDGTPPPPAQKKKRQGFVVDPVLRKALENYGMQRAEAHFRALGYDVDPSVHKNNPFDLLCTRNGEVLRVEVKATTTLGEAILLSPNEVKFAGNNKATMVLFVVNSIVVTRNEGTIALSGGTDVVTQPWDIDSGVLAATGYVWAKG